MSARRVALDALFDITEHGAYANLRLKSAQNGLSASDAKWVAALVYETLDNLYYIDYVLGSIAKGRVKPVIRCILRMSACQMLFMNIPPHAACDEGVKLAREIGKQALCAYVNGVLRELSRRLDNLPPLPDDPVERLSIKYSWPCYIIQEWLSRFGAEQTEVLLASGSFPMQIRAQQPFTTEELCSTLDKRGLGYSVGKYDPNCIYLDHGFDIADDKLFRDGSITVQSESAMLVCKMCGIEKGMRVLDACASPGGKSAYLYALSGGGIKLHALEPRENRVELLKKTLSRLRVKADIEQRDATKPAPEYMDYFDLVLIDAPCTALGSGKPDARYKKTPDDIISLAKVQKELLCTCADYVKPGGVLVYATCTITKAENEGQIESFLRGHPAFELDELPMFGGGMIQLLPHKHGVEGFFVARMRKATACT